MNVYDEFYPVAVELLEEFGTTATVTRERPAEPLTRAEKLGTQPRAPATPQTLTGLAVLPSTDALADRGRDDDTGTVLTLIAVRDGDRLQLGELTLGIGAVTSIAPQGKAVLYRGVLV